MKLLLASGSKTRAEILDKAKIPYEVVEHNVDEDEAKISYAHLNPEDIATKLAELKAIKPSYQYENSFVIGADQVLELNDTIINKAKDIIKELKEKLVLINIFDKKTLEPIVNDLIKKYETNFKGVGQPLRVALTGSKFGPGLYDIIISLGKEEVEKRLGNKILI